MAKDRSQMTIGALGEATSVGPDTIRYYERIGLLPAPARTAAGYRLYEREHLRRLNFIRRARELGLPIEEVRELLSLSSDRLRPCARVDRLVQEHLHELDHRIAGLVQLREALHDLADRCRGGGKVAECGILEALQSDQSLAGPPITCSEHEHPLHRPDPAPVGRRARG